MKILSTLTLSVLLLSGCTATNPFTRKTEISYTTIGATVCGGAGALIGGLAGQSLAATLIGGVSGAALCGGIGYYMDRQEAQLRKKLEATGVRVNRQGDTIQLVMPGNILFASNADQLNQRFYPVLDSIRDVLTEFDRTGIYVQGHADSVGSAAYNLELSRRRADSVANYLVFKGVARNRMLVQGFGKEHPIEDNATEQGRRLNRRVEILIKPR